MSPRHEELVQRALDGAVTPEEALELRAALDSDARLAEFAKQLEEVQRRLQAIAEVDPPADLREQVLAAIRPTRAMPAMPRRVRRRDALFFVAGAAVTAILTVGLTRFSQAVNEADGAATALPSSTRTLPIAVDGRELGELRWTPSSNGPSLELRWNTATPATLELELQPGSESTLRVRVGDRVNSIPLGASDSAP